MSGKGIETQLRVSIDKALKDIDKFIDQVNSKFKKVNFSPKASGSGSGNGSGGGSSKDDPVKQAEKQAKEKQKALEKQAKKELDAFKRANREFEKEDQKRVRQQEQFLKKLDKLREDYLQRYKNVEIQKGRFEAQASEHSKKVRATYEAQVTQIIANASQDNIDIVERQLHTELELSKKALAEKVKNERKEAAEELAAKNHQQKKSSKLNNTVFQVQQAIEDASFAGFRGASNNLALMANQLGGSGGTIALIGLMATTLTPTIAKLAGFGEEVEETTSSLDRMTQALKDNYEARLQAQIEFSKPLSSEGIKGKRIELAQMRKNLELRSNLLTKRDNPAEDALKIREVIESLISKTPDNPDAINKFGTMSIEDYLGSDIVGKGLDVGIDLRKMRKEGGLDFFQNAIKKSKSLLLQKEQKLERDSQIPIGEDDREKHTMFMKSAFEGNVKKEKLVEAAKQINEELRGEKQKLQQELNVIKEQERELKNVNKDFVDVMDRLNEETDVSMYKIDRKPTDEIEKRELGISRLEERMTQEAEQLKENIDKEKENLKFLIESKEITQDEAIKKEKERVELEETLRDEFSKRVDRYSELIAQEEREIENLKEARDLMKDAASLHKAVSSELEKQSLSQSKKLKQLEQEKKLSQESFELNKFGVENSIAADKIGKQGEKELKNAQKSIDKHFSPMEKYLKMMSQSPVFGQQASQQLQALEQYKSKLLQKAQEKITKKTEGKLEENKQSMFQKEIDFIKQKAEAAGTAGDFEEQQKQLEKLQQVQLQAAGQSKGEKVQNKFLQAAEDTQAKIIEAIDKQVEKEKNVNGELLKIKNNLDEINNKTLNENNLIKATKDEAQKANAELNRMRDLLNQIENGQKGVSSDLTTNINSSGKDVSNLNQQNISTQQANQSLVSNATINRATVNTLIAQNDRSPAVSSTSSSTVNNNTTRFGSLNINVSNPGNRIVDIGSAMRRAAQSSRIRMG